MERSVGRKGGVSVQGRFSGISDRFFGSLSFRLLRLVGVSEGESGGEDVTS